MTNMPLEKQDLNKEQIGILEHTKKGRFFCGESKDMDELVEKGLMEYAGRKPFVRDPYYSLTTRGSRLLLPPADDEHAANQVEDAKDMLAERGE